MPFSSSAHAATLTPDGHAYTLAPASSSIDGIDCITADDLGEEPLQICEDSSDPPIGFDLSANPAVDKALIPSRTNKKPLQLAEIRFEAVILHDLGTAPILLIPVHCFYSLHEHIRERAPPIRV